MSAFFFGKAGRQLYGFYHAPLGTANGAVVICPAWGSEYQYAHRALRVLALRLAEGGMHVLRMDYSGTGDSWGDTTDADVEQWSRDVGIGIDELRAMSDASRVDVVGLRVGGLIAACNDCMFLLRWLAEAHALIMLLLVIDEATMILSSNAGGHKIIEKMKAHMAAYKAAVGDN